MVQGNSLGGAAARLKDTSLCASSPPSALHTRVRGPPWDPFLARAGWALVGLGLVGPSVHRYEGLGVRLGDSAAWDRQKLGGCGRTRCPRIGFQCAHAHANAHLRDSMCCAVNALRGPKFAGGPSPAAAGGTGGDLAPLFRTRLRAVQVERRTLASGRCCTAARSDGRGE